jgi:hypothetical protein
MALSDTNDHPSQRKGVPCHDEGIPSMALSDADYTDDFAPRELRDVLASIANARAQGKDAMLEALLAGARELANPVRIGSLITNRGVVLYRGDVVARLIEQAGNCDLLEDPGREVVEKKIAEGLDHFEPAGRMPVSDIVTGLYARRQPDPPYEMPNADNVVELRPRAKLIATPYFWPDPVTIPRRQFLFGRHYIRAAMGATIGAGGRAKTTLNIAEATFMAAGRNPLTGETFTPLRVWLLNGEEVQDELDRRVAAIRQYYEITPAECGDRLFVQSVSDNPPRFATLYRNVPILNTAALHDFEDEITNKQFDVWRSLTP